MNPLKPKKGPKCQECPLKDGGIPVQDQLPLDSSGLTLVGEMPGRMEVNMKTCFVGPSGKLLTGALQAGNVDKDSLYITNCVRCGLPQGAKPSDSIMAMAIECCRPLLYHNMKAMGTNVACAIGAVPWKALSGMKGIDKYRGCIIQPDDEISWYTTGTLHPAGLLRVEARRIRVDLLIADLRKAHRLATGMIDPWEPEVCDASNVEGLIHFLSDAIGPFAVDVETDGIDSLECGLLTIGIAAEHMGAQESWSIPWLPAFPGYYNEEDWLFITESICNILDSEEVIFQNMGFDIPVLQRHLNIEVEGDIHDTLLLHHAAFPKLPHTLQQIASQFFAVEPWKDDFRQSEKNIDKEAKEIAKTVGEAPEELEDEEEQTYVTIEDLDEQALGELFWYNACDSAITLDLYHVLVQECKELDVYKVYEDDRKLVRQTIDWYNDGIFIDMKARAKLEVAYAKDLKKMLAELRSLCKLPPQLDIDILRERSENELAALLEDTKKVRITCTVGAIKDVQEECGYIAKSGPDLCRHTAKEHPEVVLIMAQTPTRFKESIGEDMEDYVQEGLATSPDIVNNNQLDSGTLAWRIEALEYEYCLKLFTEHQDGLLKGLKSAATAHRADVKKYKKTPTIANFNPASVVQLREVLKLRGITPTKLTDKGDNVSTGKDSLWELRDDEFVDLLFRWRTKQKLYSTYIVNLPKKLGSDGRLHPNWKLHSTPSGRFGTQPACFDGDTEVLTPKGWVRLEDASRTSSKVAQYNATTKRISFVKPTQWVRKHFKGDMVKIDTQAIRLLVTPDHRCLQKNRKTGNLEVRRADEYRKDSHQLHAGFGSGRLHLENDQIVLLCAAQADAEITTRTVRFQFDKQRKKDHMRETLNALGIEYGHKAWMEGSRSRERFTFPKEHLQSFYDLDLLKQDKTFGWSLLKLDATSREFFCEEIGLWDGHHYKGYPGNQVYSSSIPKNADIVQALMVTTGRRAKRRTYHGAKNPNYQVDIVGKDYSNPSRAEISSVPWDDMVYCLSVPSSYVLVRREGRAMITGQCQNWPKDKDDDKNMLKLMIPEEGNWIVGADYAALELRISALLAGQDDLIEAFMNDADIHAKHAGIFFPTMWPEINEKWEQSGKTDKERDKAVPERKELRGRGKNVTFGKIYRAGFQVLYEQIREKMDDVKTPAEHKRLLQEVTAMSRALDAAYPNIVDSAGIFNQIAVETFCLRTFLSGRIRKWPMGDAPPTEAANHPIQGLAADIMNAAILKLADKLIEMGLYRNGIWIILQIHDALYLEVEDQHKELACKLLEECMYTELTIRSLVTKKDHTMHFPAEASYGKSVADVG